MSQDDAVAIDPVDTDLMFRLLSLDVTRSMYSIIGLATDDDAGLVHAIRDALDVEQPTYSPQSCVDRVFATIHERLSSAAAEVVQPALWEGLSLPDDRRESFMARFFNTQDDESFATAYETAAAAPLSEVDELHASANALVKRTPQFAFIDDDLRHPAALAKTPIR